MGEFPDFHSDKLKQKLYPKFYPILGTIEQSFDYFLSLLISFTPPVFNFQSLYLWPSHTAEINSLQGKKITLLHHSVVVITRVPWQYLMTHPFCCSTQSSESTFKTEMGLLQGQDCENDGFW